MTDIQTKCMIVHALVSRLDSDIGYYLDSLETENDSGWSPETLQMIQMSGDVKMLHLLSLRLAKIQMSMLRKEAA